MSAALLQSMNEGVDGSFGFQDARKQMADAIAGEFGRILIAIWNAKTRREAARHALAAANLMCRAMAAVMDMKFPSRGRGNRSDPPKAVLAIWVASKPISGVREEGPRTNPELFGNDDLQGRQESHNTSGFENPTIVVSIRSSCREP